MNLENAASLIREDVTTIKITHAGQAGDKLYTYKCPRDIAEACEPGDMVLVRNVNGICPANVVSVDEEPDIDPEGQTIKWAFQKIDNDRLQELQDEQDRLVSRLQEKQRKHYRRSLLDALGLDQEDIKHITDGETS